MKRSEMINELAMALSKAQGEMEGAKKDSANPFFKSKYADLASVIHAIKESFSKNGLSYSQGIDTTDDGKTFVHTVLMHSSGQFTSSKMQVKPLKEDMQALGSAITYARRYALQAIAGLSAEDDDGNASVGNKVDRSTQGNSSGSKPIVESKDPNKDDMARLLGRAQSFGWLSSDVQKYAGDIGYPVLKEGLPVVNPQDFKDMYEHFGKPKPKQEAK